MNSEITTKFALGMTLREFLDHTTCIFDPLALVYSTEKQCALSTLSFAVLWSRKTGSTPASRRTHAAVRSPSGEQCEIAQRPHFRTAF
jgi:hypothetical protein